MSHDLSRRHLLGAAAAAVIAGPALSAGRAMADVAAAQAEPTTGNLPRNPVVIASANGLKAVARAAEMLVKGANPLDAVVSGVGIVEDDPNDHSVGYGGLPNEDGVVELDASVMYGPTHKAGAVASLRNIRHPSRVAQVVMQRSDHVLLVGEGALRFAKAHGFKEEDLLTDEAREIWLKWKENLSDKDDWIPPPATQPADGKSARGPKAWPDRPHGTINCNCVTSRGDLAGCTTTSGLAYKLPGRVGDSPIIGAGLYVDNAVGAAGSTGRGEANLQNCSSFFIVEQMRGGRSPEQACIEALKRVVDRTEARLRSKSGRPDFGMKYYALARDGRHGAATLYKDEGFTYAVHDGREARLAEGAYLYESR